MQTSAIVEKPIPFVTVTNWIRAAALCGIDIGRLLKEEGIDTGKLHPETALIQRESLQNLMERCVEETRATGSALHFPIVLGETFAFEYLADIETFITTSPTLREAARALEWIPTLISPFMTMTLAEHGQEARMTLDYKHADATPHSTAYSTEAVFTTMFKFTRLLLGGQRLFGRITFRHSKHPDNSASEAFFQTPLLYDQPLNALWFDRALLDQPLRGAFPSLHEQAEQRVVQKVALRVEQQHDPADLHSQGQLIDLIEQTLALKPRLLGHGLQALADELDLHARTLQRRLHDLNESHSSVLARVRYRLAQQWLQDAKLPIEEISERLGFSDRRSFTQAFTRWSGQTPSQFRRQAP